MILEYHKILHKKKEPIISFVAQLIKGKKTKILFYISRATSRVAPSCGH